MKKPKKPPSPPVYSKVAPERLQKWFSLATSVRVNGKYLHWEKFRYHEPPSDLSVEEWWHAVKLLRQSQKQSTPLADKSGQPFEYLTDSTIQEKLHQIDLGAGGRISMPQQITNPDTRDRYYIHSLIEEAITSSQLEGAQTMRQVAKEMIKSRRQPRDRSEKMILNNFLTMKRISEIKQDRLTPELIFNIHRLVSNDAIDNLDAVGRLRNDNEEEEVAVYDTEGNILHQPPHASQLPGRLTELCRFANGQSPDGFVHPVIRAIIVHFWLAYDHPFVDGNGRTARALFYWSMLHHGYWLFEFISISSIIKNAPVKYGRAFLWTETDDNDLTYFVDYHLHVIDRAIHDLHEYISKKSKELKQTEKNLKNLSLFNHRQLALLSHAFRHPDADYTIESHRLSHNVVYQTARTDLVRLCDLGLLVDRKVGKTIHFRPVQNISEKLKTLD